MVAHLALPFYVPAGTACPRLFLFGFHLHCCAAYALPAARGSCGHALPRVEHPWSWHSIRPICGSSTNFTMLPVLPSRWNLEGHVTPGLTALRPHATPPLRALVPHVRPWLCFNSTRRTLEAVAARLEGLELKVEGPVQCVELALSSASVLRSFAIAGLLYSPPTTFTSRDRSATASSEGPFFSSAPAKLSARLSPLLRGVQHRIFGPGGRRAHAVQHVELNLRSMCSAHGDSGRVIFSTSLPTHLVPYVRRIPRAVLASCA
jgi:hypothetical protein